jgi:hypothetical protein
MAKKRKNAPRKVAKKKKGHYGARRPGGGTNDPGPKGAQRR